MVSYDARKNAARDLARRTGMRYTDALVVVRRDRTRELQHRWVLTDEVTRFFAGEGWRGLYFEDLYSWLDNLTPVFECYWCGQPCDARMDEASIELVVASYDPDLSPATGILTTHKCHAACRPSLVTWARRADLPVDRTYGIALPATANPDMLGEIAVTATPFLFPDDDGGTVAVLLLSLAVTEDHGEGATPWLHELQMALAQEGVGHPDSLATGSAEDWSLRIATEPLGRQWLALRTSPPKVGMKPDHLYLGTVDLPNEWSQAAREAGRITVFLGPFPQTGEVPDLPELDRLDAEQFAELVDDGVLIVGNVRVDTDA